MPEGAAQALSEKIAQMDYVRAFQRVEAELRADSGIWQDYERMKALQQEAVLYQRIDKPEAYRETTQAAQALEKRLKRDARVEEYFLAMQDVEDLLQYVTGRIEQDVNAGLTGD